MSPASAPKRTAARAALQQGRIEDFGETLIGARKSTALSSEERQTTLLKGIRSAVRNDKDLRIVMDLGNRVRPRSFLLQPDGKSGYRLVVDMYQTRLSPTPVKTQREQRRKMKSEIIIAIDPGHGGKDPGAIGHKGTREKDVVLALGRKLKKQITKGYAAYEQGGTRDFNDFLGELKGGDSKKKTVSKNTR